MTAPSNTLKRRISLALVPVSVVLVVSVMMSSLLEVL